MSEQDSVSCGNSLDENQLITLRREKLARWRDSHIAYPNDFRRDVLARELHDAYDQIDREQLEEHPQTVRVAGRMMLKRVMGKASFATVQDMSGHIQLYISKNLLGDDLYTEFKHFDLGDILGAKVKFLKQNMVNYLSVLLLFVC